MRLLHWLAFILIVIGALNWGLIGFFNIDVVALLFGPMTVLSRIIYTVVGLAGLYLLIIKLIKALIRHSLSKF